MSENNKKPLRSAFANRLIGFAAAGFTAAVVGATDKPAMAQGATTLLDKKVTVEMPWYGGQRQSYTVKIDCQRDLDKHPGTGRVVGGANFFGRFDPPDGPKYQPLPTNTPAQRATNIQEGVYGLGHISNGNPVSHSFCKALNAAYNQRPYDLKELKNDAKCPPKAVIKICTGNGDRVNAPGYVVDHESENATMTLAK